ncbi:MAG TPA: BspA family leucine-rich repeat surface protein, partial [Wenzhouxiangella sp.]
KNIGGLVGFSYSGTIENSYALGTITVGDGAQHVATILGNHVNTPIISNSYGAVSITTGTGSQHIGGLLGSVTGLSTGDLVDSFYSKDLPGNGTDDCDTNIGTLLCGEGKTDFELKERSTFANWSFDGASPIWQMASGDFVSYPYLVTPEQDPAPGLEGAPMVLEFDTTLGDGTTISLPFDADVDVRIDWGDGNEDSITTAGFAEHTYAAEGSYTVSIYGQLTHFGRRGPTSLTFPNSEKLTAVTSFGNLGIRSLTGAFKDATNLTAVPSALPDSVIRLRSTFEGATSFNGDLSGWDVSQVIDLTSLFFGATAFNQPIGGWNVSNVRSLYRTFANAESFNQPLNDWDVSNIKSFNRAFYNARSFNQDLNDWQLISAQDTGYMFSRAAAFNGDITNWRTGTVKNMTRMFAYTEAFNQPIGGWDVSEVTSFNAMFGNAKTFDQPLNTWQPVKGKNFGQMFAGAVQFNQPLNDWNVGQATNMRRMFRGARQFNQPLDDWNISNVEDFQSFLDGTSMSTQNYDAMLESFAAQSVQSDVTLEVGTIRYNEGAPASARAKLITDNNWTVIDGGMIPTFSGGNGEETAPHKISSLDDLRTLSEDPNSWALNFELTTSIDASDTATWNSGAGFSPIGDDITRFTGSFTGNGHQITGLVINRPNQSQVGLFGSVAGMVDSLSLIDVDIKGNTEVGGLAGFNGGLVLDVAITGQVEGMVEIGGLVGVNGSLGHISSVASHADVTGSNMVGGVIGKNQGVLADGYATGTLESSQTVGGLVGSFIDARSVIERGYSAATMTTSGQGQTPGGIIGSLGTQNKDAAGGQVRQSFFVGSLTPEGSKLPSFENYSIDAATIDSKGLRSTKGPIGTDTDWAINGSNSEWAMLSVDDIQANGKFYRAYPYLRIFDYDEPGAIATNLPLPGLIEMPMPPVIDRDSTSVSGDTLTLVFSVPQDSPDATVNGIEYSLDNGETWQAASQTASPITVTGLDDNRAYGVRVRAQTDQGSGPMSDGYRVITGGRIFKDSFEQASDP